MNALLNDQQVKREPEKKFGYFAKYHSQKGSGHRLLMLTVQQSTDPNISASYYLASIKHYRLHFSLHLFISVFYWTLHMRSLVLKHFNCASWEDHKNESVYKLAGNIHSMLLNVPNCPSTEAVAFLCSYNNIHCTGSSAHTACEMAALLEQASNDNNKNFHPF